jgi:hypothetical protein
MDDESASADGGGGGGGGKGGGWAHGFATGYEDASEPEKRKRREPTGKERGPSVSFAEIVRTFDSSRNIVISGADREATGGAGGESDSHATSGTMIAPKCCRACRSGYFVDGNSKLADAIAALVRNYQYSVSMAQLIEEAYLLGEKEREDVLHESGEDIGEWSREDIHYHLFTCMTDFNLFTLKEISELKVILASVKDNLYYIDGTTGRPITDVKNMQLMMQLQAQIKMLITVAPERANSFNPGLSTHSSVRKYTKRG